MLRCCRNWENSSLPNSHMPVGALTVCLLKTPLNIVLTDISSVDKVCTKKSRNTARSTMHHFFVESSTAALTGSQLILRQQSSNLSECHGATDRIQGGLCHARYKYVPSGRPRKRGLH